MGDDDRFINTIKGSFCLGIFCLHLSWLCTRVVSPAWELHGTSRMHPLDVFPPVYERAMSPSNSDLATTTSSQHNLILHPSTMSPSSKSPHLIMPSPAHRRGST
jgi:hypothetical protein